MDLLCYIAVKKKSVKMFSPVDINKEYYLNIVEFSLHCGLWQGLHIQVFPEYILTC